MVMPGLINLDFADVRSVMSEMGKAMMGTGEGSGDNRAIEAAEQAIANPLLDGVSMKGAKGVIISITGGEDMRLMEVDEAANHIKELVDPDANIIWGSAFNNDLDGKLRVSVVATGIGAEEIMPFPQPAKVFAFPARTTETRTTPETGTVELPPLTLTPPEPLPELAETGEAPMALDTGMTAETQAPAEPMGMAEAMDMGRPMETATPMDMTADQPAEEDIGDELLLDSVDMAAADEPMAAGEPDMAATTGTRSWMTQDEAQPEEAAETRQSGTLFERMSNIARGAAKAQVPEAEEEEAPRMRAAARDPLDIPRFLNRQNNQ